MITTLLTCCREIATHSVEQLPFGSKHAHLRFMCRARTTAEPFRQVLVSEAVEQQCFPCFPCFLCSEIELHAINQRARGPLCFVRHTMGVGN